MIAVLTGDLVRSSHLSREQIEQAEHQVRQLAQDYSGCRSEWFRGDGFQVVVPNPDQTVAILVRLMCQLIAQGLSASVSAGIGPGDNDRRPGLAQGRAFELSGRGLEKSNRGEISLYFEQSELNQQVQLPTAFLSFLLSKLTSKQAQVIDDWVAHQFCDHQQVADRLAMTRQNVSLHLSKAGGSLIEQYQDNFKTWLFRLGH